MAAKYRYEIIEEQKPVGDRSNKNTVESALSQWAREGWTVAHYSVAIQQIFFSGSTSDSYLVHNFILER